MSNPSLTSPFPGMDPYLEDPAIWRDFHSRFINAWCEAVSDRLPENYAARIDEQVTLISGGEPPRAVLPDVAITQAEQSPADIGARAAEADVATATVPLLMPPQIFEPYIEVYHRPEMKLVAVLELLSPTNKSGDGRGIHLAKRNAILAQEVHLVELDLLVGGRRPPFARPLPPGDYYAFVSHALRRPDCRVHAWTLREPLPRLPVPLLPPDADAVVSLPSAFQIAYQRGRYGNWLRYKGPPAAPLSDADRQWAVEVVGASRGCSRARFTDTIAAVAR